jgi:hypothetical protein
LALAFAAFLFAGGAAGQNLGTFFTDLWYTPGEDGWGVTVDHQQNVMFLTFYVYRADGTPYWVTAVLGKTGTSGLATFPDVFSGDVFEDRGPWFGNPFNPASVTESKVGTATFTALPGLKATLQYSVNGVTVSKNIERLTLRNIDNSGQYSSQTLYELNNCKDAASDGTVVNDSGTMSINQTGASFQLTTHGHVTSCTFNGGYSQHGSLGQVDGKYACTDGTEGTFVLGAIQWTLFGMSAFIHATNQSCELNGALGGVTWSHFQF